MGVKNADISLVKQLPDGVEVGLSKGTKTTSEYDFRVHFRWSSSTRWRTPSHIHLIVDMYTKRMGNPWLTKRFVDFVLSDLIGGAQAATSFPPLVPLPAEEALARFMPLNAFGEYTVDFIVTVQGLIAAAEKTNYPNGTLQSELWTAFRDGDEIYRVLGIALR
jgi:hypothetical protein